MDVMNDETMPVFLINGFLESGKTRFLNFTMEQDYFQTDEKTLLLICEDGEEEYDEVFLKDHKTAAIFIEDISEMTPERLTELELLYNPARVVVEWNGMWNLDDWILPEDWVIYQQITLINAETFTMYYNNMRQLFAGMVKNSELIICNRCQPTDDLAGMKRALRMLNAVDGDVIFENEEGEVRELLEEDLPYDLTRDVVKVTEEAFGIWYLDALDNPDRYVGKTFEFTAMVLKSPEFPRNYFVPGRMAMACCEEDMTFLGFVCKAREAKNLQTKDWVKVRARMEYEYWQDYEGDGPVLYAEEVVPAQPIKAPVMF